MHTARLFRLKILAIKTSIPNNCGEENKETQQLKQKIQLLENRIETLEESIETLEESEGKSKQIIKEMETLLNLHKSTATMKDQMIQQLTETIEVMSHLIPEVTEGTPEPANSEE